MTVDPGTPPIARLEQNLAAHPAVGSGELEKALMDVLDGPAFGAWLDDLAEDPGAVARLAAASCWHANGFAKLVLHRADGYALRLHVWPHDGRPQTGDSEPHSHAGPGAVLGAVLDRRRDRGRRHAAARPERMIGSHRR